MKKDRSVESWRDLLIGATIFLALAGAFDFIDSNHELSTATRALHSFGFAVLLLAGAAVGAGIVWGVLRAIRGPDGAPDVKDALLWNACLIGGLVTALRMLR